MRDAQRRMRPYLRERAVRRWASSARTPKVCAPAIHRSAPSSRRTLAAIGDATSLVRAALASNPSWDRAAQRPTNRVCTATARARTARPFVAKTPFGKKADSAALFTSHLPAGRNSMSDRSMKKARKRAPRIVPSIVFKTVAAAGIIPAVVFSCSSGSAGPDTSTSSSSSSGLGVAAVAFNCYQNPNAPQCPQGVAAVAFSCYQYPNEPACRDAGADSGRDSGSDGSRDGSGDGAG